MADSVSQKVLRLHRELRFWWNDLCRVAIALYNPQDDQLTTFVSSNDKQDPLLRYHAPLSSVPSLQRLAREKRTRVIDDLLSHDNQNQGEHTRHLIEAGFRSSYTVPMFSNSNDLLGFLFFDSEQASYFNEALTRHLDVYAELLSALVQSEIAPVQTLGAAVFTAQRFTDLRDEETGAHLARVAFYSRLIASNLAEQYDLDDEYIEFLHQFAPLHDIGKVAIPDHILLCRQRLEPQQREIMQSHVTRGLQIVDEMIGNFGLGTVDHMEMLREVVLRHHEDWDGSGYPDGLQGEQIPLAARIVSLADCFDALMSERPYKPAWPYAQVRAHIRDQAGRKFDPACVEAMLRDEAQLAEARERFVDQPGADTAR